MRTYIVLFSVLFCSCGSSSPMKIPDAGPDTSCGLDCVAQQRFGLKQGLCFEYASTSMHELIPVMGAEVQALDTLETGTQVLPVAYKKNGQTVLTDSFTISGGDLRLVRRSFGPGVSVTYKDASDVLTGVKWLNDYGQVFDNAVTSSQAYVVGQSPETTSYNVTLSAAPNESLHTPYQTFDGGMQLVFTETPSHHPDTFRTWVPNVGFVYLYSTLGTYDTSAHSYYLQAIRDISHLDAGVKACSLGN